MLLDGNVALINTESRRHNWEDDKDEEQFSHSKQVERGWGGGYKPLAINFFHSSWMKNVFLQAVQEQ